MNMIKKFYSVCLIIIATSAVNLSMIFYYIKHIQKINLENMQNNKLIDQMLKTPQIVSDKKESQMEKIKKKTNINVAVVDNFAYWAEDNILFKADINEDGTINISNKKPVDVMSMSKRELNGIIKIVDSIN